MTFAFDMYSKQDQIRSVPFQTDGVLRAASLCMHACMYEGGERLLSYPFPISAYYRMDETAIIIHTHLDSRESDHSVILNLFFSVPGPACDAIRKSAVEWETSCLIDWIDFAHPQHIRVWGWESRCTINKIQECPKKSIASALIHFNEWTNRG